MESNGENNENIEAQVVVNAESAGAENNQESQENQESTPPSWQEQAIAFAKENGREVESIDDFFKPVEVEKEVIKEVNPYEGLLDENDKAFYEVKKNHPGLTKKEFESINVDVDKIDPLTAAREQARKEIGSSALSDELADEYIADKFGFDDFDDLSDLDKAKLQAYGKPVRDEIRSKQELYRKPVEENNTETKQESASPEYVTLPNGMVQRKEDFEASQIAQQKEKEIAVQAVKTVTAANFKMSVDDKGVVTHVPLPYEYQPQDSQKMESIVTDLSGTIDKRYKTDQGFNHAAFAEDMLWSDREFREKTISDIATKARAQAIEEVLKGIGNHNFNPDKPLDKQTTEGVRYVPFSKLGQ